MQDRRDVCQLSQRLSKLLAKYLVQCNLVVLPFLIAALFDKFFDVALEVPQLRVRFLEQVGSLLVLLIQSGEQLWLHLILQPSEVILGQ